MIGYQDLNSASSPNRTATSGTRSTPQGGVNSQGVYTNSNKIYDIFTIPPQFTVTTTSAAGSGAAVVTQYIFNTSVLTASDTDNGSGANSCVITYGDGYSGRAYDNIVRAANNGKGVWIQGFTINSTTTSTGAQNASAFNTLNMQVLNANLMGGTLPIAIGVNSALRNTQQQVGILTVRQPFTLNALNQISYSQPVDSTFAWTFITETGSLD